MKKIYIIPNTTIVKIETSKIIASSPGAISAFSTELGSEDVQFSRRSNAFWDDEEYDEY